MREQEGLRLIYIHWFRPLTWWISIHSWLKFSCFSIHSKQNDHTLIAKVLKPYFSIRFLGLSLQRVIGSFAAA